MKVIVSNSTWAIAINNTLVSDLTPLIFYFSKAGFRSALPMPSSPMPAEHLLYLSNASITLLECSIANECTRIPLRQLIACSLRVLIVHQEDLKAYLMPKTKDLFTSLPFCNSLLNQNKRMKGFSSYNKLKNEQTVIMFFFIVQNDSCVIFHASQ